MVSFIGANGVGKGVNIVIDGASYATLYAKVSTQIMNGEFSSKAGIFIIDNC